VRTPDSGYKNIDAAPRWKIDGNKGDRFTIFFYRNPERPLDMQVTWEGAGSGPAVEPEPRYFLVAAQNKWGQDSHIEMRKIGNTVMVACELELKERQEPFRIVMFKRSDLCIHPDKSDCSQNQAHSVLGPDAGGIDHFWSVGKAATDKARVGDVFTIMYDTSERKVSWKKK